MKVLTRSPLDILQRMIVLSLDPEAKYSPFGENATLLTLLECPHRDFMPSPTNRLYSYVVLVKDLCFITS